LSSATIRNIFAELEEGGLLTHSHTSGGRIPTDKGYRYYVDFIISQMELLDNEKQHIIREYKKELKQMDEALEETSEIISAITHYTGIVSFLEWQDRFFYKGISRILEQPEFKNHEKIRILISIIEERQRLLDILNRDFSEKVKVYIGHELGCPEMEDCSLVVSSYRCKDRPLGKLAVLGPMRMEYKRIIPALEYISCVLTEVLGNI
jgi:transcriptional regulator of heat shock response